MSDDQGTIEDGELVVEDGEPTVTDNGLRPEDGSQLDIQRFVDAALAGKPIDETPVVKP